MGVFITNVFSASVNRTVSKFHACELGVNGLEHHVRTCTSASMGRAHYNWKYLMGSNRAALRGDSLAVAVSAGSQESKKQVFPLHRAAQDTVQFTAAVAMYTNQDP